jgi:uncharacterized protein (TIGR00725 family)
MLLIVHCRHDEASTRNVATMKPPAQARKRIAVLGPGEASSTVIALAAEVGAQLAQRNAILVCGGLGGCMAAAARAARALGGTTVGVLPGYDATAASDGIEIPLATGLGEARNVVVVASADAVIAIGGAAGTLSEIALALKLGRRIVGLQTWELRAPDGSTPPILRARDPSEAVELALEDAVDLSP